MAIEGEDSTYEVGFRGAGTFRREDDDEVILVAVVDACLRRLADRIDWDSARSRDRKDRSAIESRRGWRVK